MGHTVKMLITLFTRTVAAHQIIAACRLNIYTYKTIASEHTSHPLAM